MSIVARVAHLSCCCALYSYAVNGDPGVPDCQSVGRQVKMYSPSLPLSIPFFTSSPLALPFLPFSPLEVGPLIAAWGLVEGISSPAGPGGARLSNAFWCIVGIN